jgi:two-component system CheB/CheR fusion protein
MSQNAAPESPAPKGRIVLVDDHEDSLAMLSAALRMYGYEVHTSNSGDGGLALAEQHQADAMVVDLVMPGMSGFEVARRARECLGQKPVLIALSGYGERSNRIRCREAGFDYHLLKPVTANDLVRYIEGKPSREGSV